MKTTIAIALATFAATALAADGLDLGSLKPKDPSSTTTPATTPIGASPLKKITGDATTPATGNSATNAAGTKASPLNKNLFGAAPGKSDAAGSSDSSSASDDVKVKMPSNFKK